MEEESVKPMEGSTTESQSEPDVSTEDLQKKIDELRIKRLADLENTLRETEARIDKKITNFKKFVENTEIQGTSMSVKPIMKSEDEMIKERANALLKGTGLSVD
jgi:CRISPR/Cas system endoribonuclease Cas6 (RAMP superfamily)